MSTETDQRHQRHQGKKRKKWTKTIRLCAVQDCPKGAQDKTTGFCKAHGGGRRCAVQDCPKSARDKTTGFCSVHGGGRRCTVQDCPKSALGKTEFCIAHGGGRRCAVQDCPKSAAGKTEFCRAHGGGRRCANCIDWIDSRGCDKKYDGYCATCFKRLFPEDPRSTVIYEHTKEIRVRNAISEQFVGFVHDTPLWTGNCDCTHRRRVDHRKLIGNTMIAVETDEYCHRTYDEKDEEIRYDDLYMIHSGKWIFIRFNPDKTRTQYTDLEDRIPILLEMIETRRIPNCWKLSRCFTDFSIDLTSHLNALEDLCCDGCKGK